MRTHTTPNQMWRQNILTENQDSDRSISDEEDIHHNPFINPRKITASVQMPILQNLDISLLEPSNVLQSISDEDKISEDDDKGNNLGTKSDFDKPGSVKEECKKSTWSSVFEETKELMRLHETGSGSIFHSANYEHKKIWRGSRGKSKPKFSFGSHPDKEASLPSPTMNKNEKSTKVYQDLEDLEGLEHGTNECSMTELLEGLQKDNRKQSNSQLVPFGLPNRQRNTELPISELLEGLLESHGPLRGTPKMNKEAKGKRSVLTTKRSRSSISYDKGEPCEPMDSTSSSDEENAKLQLQVYENHLKSTTLDISGQTMADRFQEALNAAAVNDQEMLFATNKQTGIGYCGRLQQVMQSEKEWQMEFLNQSRAAIRGDEVRFIDVKILSRYLDAKLTVCHCLLESPTNYSGRRRVIFSSKICNNVELQVGNLVRIHQPWKEVQVARNEAAIILATYFSQIPI